MKRDMDLVRHLLIQLEGLDGPALPTVPDVDGYPKADVLEHIRLMIDAKLITAIDASSFDGPNYINIKMTWQGHEFLSVVRDPEIWKKTKAGATKLGTWTISMLGEMATGYVKMKAAELGLPIG